VAGGTGGIATTGGNAAPDIGGAGAAVRDVESVLACASACVLASASPGTGGPRVLYVCEWL
jgi:hypothetical protein